MEVKVHGRRKKERCELKMKIVCYKESARVTIPIALVTVTENRPKIEVSKKLIIVKNVRCMLIGNAFQIFSLFSSDRIDLDNCFRRVKHFLMTSSTIVE